MLINTTFAVVVFCADCGRAHVEEVSYFYMGYDLLRPVSCICGKKLGEITAVLPAGYKMTFCYDKLPYSHYIKVDKKIFNDKKIYPIAIANESIGFFGSLQAVRKELKMAKRYSRISVAELDDKAMVADPKVMFEVINKIDKLAMTGNIICGECGHNRPSLDVFDTFIMLYCEKCGNVHKINAQSKDDMKHINDIDFLELIDETKQN